MLTVKVNGTALGLVHKGSMHFAKNTVPDVCKTPSPGGPVPIPYPVIISLASDLANGTTTVKADGGNMIAVKGCEYAMCTGDEAGTAGGVASSTFKKEAKFILYSFDVKMDGKNACRQTDKMTMNHQNTVCLGGTTPVACAGSTFELNIDCDAKKKKKKRPWTDCMCKELCAKVAAFNKAKKAKPKKVSPSPSEPGAPGNAAYTAGIAKFESNFDKAVDDHGADSPQVKKMFMHECRHEEWKAAGCPRPLDRSRSNKGVNPDHMRDAGLGGSLKTTNLKWLNSRVNGTLGGCMRGFDDSVHNKIKANPNCGCKS